MNYEHSLATQSNALLAKMVAIIGVLAVVLFPAAAFGRAPASNSMQVEAQLAGGYLEDFNDGEAQGWIPAAPAHWSVVGGEYRAQSADTIRMQSTYGEEVWDDCSLRAKVRRTGGETNAAVLIVRATENFDWKDSVGSAYLAGHSGGGAYYVGKYVDGSFSSLQSWTAFPHLNTGDAVNMVRLDIEGNALTVFFNDELAWSGTDDSIAAAGRIGVMGYTVAGTPTTYYFDDVRVTVPYSCWGHCGGNPGDCWCDSGCNWIGDCCEDVCDACPYHLWCVCDAVDNCDLGWSSGGDAPWFAQSDVSYDGESAAQSGAITHNQESWLETTAPADGWLSFWWKVDSESGWDFLEFYVDGVRQHRISGNVDWQQRDYVVDAGAVLRWRYTKDVTISHGADSGWLDQVVFVPLGGSIDVEDSIPPGDDHQMPFGEAPVGDNLTEQLTVHNSHGALSLVVNEVTTNPAHYEGFDDGLAQGWIPVVPAHWSVVGGEYRAQSADTIPMQSSYGDKTWCDVAFRATLRRTGSLTSAAVLVIRATDDFDWQAMVGSAYMIGIAADGKYYVGKYVDGVFSWIRNWSASPHLVTGESSNQVLVVISGPDMEVYFNGNLAWSGADSAITAAGRVGVMGYTNAADPTTHYFDSLLAARRPAGRVALFQDTNPWGSTRNQQVLGANALFFDVYGVGSLGAIDLSAYDKVIVSSSQSVAFYDALETNRAWFEAYVNAGGLLDMRLAAGFGAPEGRVFPGGFSTTPVYSDTVSIENAGHPLFLEPHAISEDELQNWNLSSHGYFGLYPPEAHTLVSSGGEPCTMELALGQGRITATLQTVDWVLASWNYLENLILYGLPAASPFGLADVPELPLLLGPGESFSVDVIYAPETAGAHEDALWVFSSDAGDPEIMVALSGTGVEFVPLYHPGDANEDWRMVMGEAITYLVGWQTGGNPMSYAIRGAYLWQNGEFYLYDPAEPPPMCWILVLKGAAAKGLGDDGDAVALSGTDRVVVTVAPPSGTTVWGLEQYLPEGLAPVDLAGPHAAWDPVNRKLTWWNTGSAPETVGYGVSGAPGAYPLVGAASFDGAEMPLNTVEIRIAALAASDDADAPDGAEGADSLLSADAGADAAQDGTSASDDDALLADGRDAGAEDGALKGDGDRAGCDACGSDGDNGGLPGLRKRLADWLLVGLGLLALVVLTAPRK